MQLRGMPDYGRTYPLHHYIRFSVVKVGLYFLKLYFQKISTLSLTRRVLC